jgi:hypothetical protein
MQNSDIWPSKTSKTWLLLRDLLNGDQIDVIDTMTRYNLMTPNARVSELRGMGWPIRSLKVAHPTLLGEEVTAYYMEVGFRHWWVENDQDANPWDYPRQEGRGKFAE